LELKAGEMNGNGKTSKTHRHNKQFHGVQETKKLQNRGTRFSSHKKLDDLCVHALLIFDDLMLMMKSSEGIIIKLHITTS